MTIVRWCLNWNVKIHYLFVYMAMASLMFRDKELTDLFVLLIFFNARLAGEDQPTSNVAVQTMRELRQSVLMRCLRWLINGAIGVMFAAKFDLF